MECVVWVVGYGSENAEEQGNKRERPSEQPPKKKKKQNSNTSFLFHSNGANFVSWQKPHRVQSPKWQIEFIFTNFGSHHVVDFDCFTFLSINVCYVESKVFVYFFVHIFTNWIHTGDTWYHVQHVRAFIRALSKCSSLATFYYNPTTNLFLFC